MAYSQLLLIVVSLTAVLAKGILRVNPETRRIIDDEGRERYFHGVNVVVKQFPWIPEGDVYPFNETDMQRLQKMGLNSLRLGMMWPGVEPQKGQYNYTYLKVARDITNKVAEYGIYTLLDMHQDAFSHKLCGEGFPAWAVMTGNAPGVPVPMKENPYPVDPKTGYPSGKMATQCYTDQDCSKLKWYAYYFAEATNAAFQMLYNNTDGLLDSMGRAWSVIADYFKEDANILGYELINEPWPGDVYADPGLFLPSNAAKKNLQPAYDHLNKAIRAKDDQHSVYFEGVTWEGHTSGFDHVPGGDEYRNRSVLSYHFYRPPDILPEPTFAARRDDLQRLGCAGFLTEFDISLTLSSKSLLYDTLDQADFFLQSWTGWDYRPQYDIAALSRTYAPSVAGVTQTMTYSNVTQDFTLVYMTVKECTSNVTEIYLNEALHYPKGYTVSVFPSTSVTWKSGGTNKILVEHLSLLPLGAEVQVMVNAK